MNSGCIFFYVNADNRIGSGHFWRCIYIANEVQKFHTKIFFIYSFLDYRLIKLLEEKKINHIHLHKLYTEDFLETIISINPNKNPGLLVTDTDNTFFYEKAFQLKIIQANIRLMTITVNASFHYYSHILLNQNVIANSQNYSVENYTHKLLGPEYFIYSPQFRKLSLQPVKTFGNTIFIAFGSADPSHFTFQLVSKILDDNDLSDFNFYIVIGAMNKDYQKIKELCKANNKIHIYYNVDNVSSIMLKCNLAFCAPGLMFWELTLLGVHSILFSGSEREKILGTFLHEQGYAHMFHHYDEMFSDKKFILFKQLIRGLDENDFVNFKKLREKINPNGVQKIASEINSVLNVKIN